MSISSVNIKLQLQTSTSTSSLKSIFHFKLQLKIATSIPVFNLKLQIYTLTFSLTLHQPSHSTCNFKLQAQTLNQFSASNWNFNALVMFITCNLTPKTIVNSLLDMVSIKLQENLRIKKKGTRTDEQMNGRTNSVTESLLELLIAEKNVNVKFKVKLKFQH